MSNDEGYFPMLEAIEENDFSLCVSIYGGGFAICVVKAVTNGMSTFTSVDMQEP